MNLRPRRSEEPEINLTPLIDVVFLMLIFFMVSTTFQREANLRVVLPEASAQPVPMQADVVEITINAAGDYFIDGEATVNRQRKTLRLALEPLADADPPLVIRADAKTPHQAVVTAMEAAGEAGFSRVNIATVPEEAE